MQVLLAICLVVATAAEVTIAVVAIRALSRFNRATSELEQSARVVREFAAQAKSASHEVQAFVASLREAVSPVRRAAEAIGEAGERAADLSSTVLSQMEGSVRRTLDLFRGVQAGAGYFFNRLAHNGRATTRGGNSDE
jgi:biopolymer transport protein ExbB/TolQ